MLKQRVFTALVLAALLLFLLLFSPWYLFALFMAFVLCLAAWEWSALAGWQSLPARLLYLVLTVCLGAAAAWLVWDGGYDLIRNALVIACSWWALALLWVQGYPSSALLWKAPVMRSLMGWLVLISAWLALLFLRSEPTGAMLVLWVILTVACADIGAYFTGRALGKRKLAPRVSPAKSWEGVAGGLCTAVAVALVFNALWGRSGDWWLVIAVIVPTVLASVVGDLFESMLKRHCGVKDSGRLLPGHGGVLDRIDGLTAAAPVFALALVLTGWQPG